MKLTITLLFVLVFFKLNAQSNFYYYYKGEKVYLTLDKKKVFLTTNTEFQENTILDLGIENIQLQTYSGVKKGELAYNIEPTTTDYFQKFNTLLSNPEIRNASLYFKMDNTSSIGTSNIFYVKLNNESDLSLLQQTANQKDVTILHQNQFMPLWCKLEVNPNNPKTSLQLSNEFYETGYFADIDPAFMFNFKIDHAYDDDCANDDDFDQLWGLHNPSDPNLDISICDAWSITEGNGVNVAVVDTGIYKFHNDLSANISPLSYDANTGSSPSVFIPNDAYQRHGTQVAGVIGALKDNNLQAVGVAPQSNIISVSHDLIMPNEDISGQLADGINWAWQNGADVINNSWSDQGGLYFDIFQSSLLENAIENALSQGRDGLGTAVIFAAGNTNSAIGYPGNYHPDILCVGAMMQSGAKAAFSSFGPELDVVAPGKDILTLAPNQGTDSVDGTSFAAPHVTGVVVLMIAINPCISVSSINNIIEQTAKKVGNYSYTNNPSRPNGTWHEEMGYGLIDAYAAVQMAENISSTTLDLYIKDNVEDTGIEPNPTDKNMWSSEDIWVRNFDDNGLSHQNPKYNPPVIFQGDTLAIPNYIYVRVKNRSCIKSTRNDTLVLNWAKANTALMWPDNWNGSLQNENNFDLGRELEAVVIPNLEAGSSTILKIPWEVPNPNNYSDN